MNKIYEDEIGTLHLELAQGLPVIHCEIYKWSRKSLNHCFEVWSELLYQLNEKGFKYLFAPISPDDNKLKKFASMFGMENTGIESIHIDGKKREIWRIECLK